MFLIIDNRNEDFPIDGRAPIIIKSEFCQPLVILSRAENPDGIPFIPVLFLPAVTISLIDLQLI